MNPDLGKVLIILGAAVFLAGVAIKLNLFPWLGRLPGDIAIRRENFSFHFPLTTCIVVSVALTLLMSLFRK